MCTIIFFCCRYGNSSIGSCLPNPLAFCSESSLSLVMSGPFDEKTRGVEIFRLLKSCFLVDVCTTFCFPFWILLRLLSVTITGFTIGSTTMGSSHLTRFLYWVINFRPAIGIVRPTYFFACSPCCCDATEISSSTLFNIANLLNLLPWHTSFNFALLSFFGFLTLVIVNQSLWFLVSITRFTACTVRLLPVFLSPLVAVALGSLVTIPSADTPCDDKTLQSLPKCS